MTNSEGTGLEDGKTIEDLPTLKEILIDTKILSKVTNNYVRLNNILYEVISINKNDTINLIETNSYIINDYKITFDTDMNNYLPFQYYGLVKNENYGFSQLIKGTTLGDIIISKDNEYLIFDQNKNFIERRCLQ